jgi:hypothetical protein
MNIPKFLLLGVPLIFTAWACAGVSPIVRTNPENCDHQEPETFSVEVIIDKNDDKKKPSVKPKAIVACSQDTIDFKRGVGSAHEEFSIEFEKANSYFKNLKSRNGRVGGKVMADPGSGKKPVFLKYWVKVEGREDLDPRIIITPR